MQSDARELAAQVENEAAANEYAGLPHSAAFYREISATLIQQAEEIERLHKATERLATFAGHDDGCQTMLGSWGQVEACSCGYTEAWQARRER